MALAARACRLWQAAGPSGKLKRPDGGWLCFEIGRFDQVTNPKRLMLQIPTSTDFDQFDLSG
jgi:hypothetical protein